MCWQDVQIARSQTLRSVVSDQVTAPITQLYQAYMRRVRFVITVSSDTTTVGGVAVEVFLGNTASDLLKRVFCGGYVTPIIFDQETYGQILQQQLTISINGSFDNMRYSIAEFELADPQGLGNPATNALM